MNNNLKHFSNLTNDSLLSLKVGEYFTYKDDWAFRKGLKVSHKYMVPIGLFCNSIEAAKHIPE